MFEWRCACPAFALQCVEFDLVLHMQDHLMWLLCFAGRTTCNNIDYLSRIQWWLHQIKEAQKRKMSFFFKFSFLWIYSYTDKHWKLLPLIKNKSNLLNSCTCVILRKLQNVKQIAQYVAAKAEMVDRVPTSAEQIDASGASPSVHTPHSSHPLC